MPATTKSWADHLRPFVNELHPELSLVTLPTREEFENAWIYVEAPSGDENTRREWILLAETLELLDLLARVDNRACWRLLAASSAMQEVFSAYESVLFPPDAAPVLPKFVVTAFSSNLILEIPDFMQGAIHLIISNSQHESKQFQKVKKLLLDAWTQQHDGKRFDRDVAGRAEVSMEFHFDDRLDGLAIDYVFSKLSDLAYASMQPEALYRVEGEEGGEHEQGEQPARPGTTTTEAAATGSTADHGSTQPRDRGTSAPARGALQTKTFRYLLKGHRVNNHVLYRISEAAKSGMRVSSLLFTSLRHSDLHSSVIGDLLLNLLVPWAGRRDELGVTDLTFSLGDFDAAGVRAFATAIVHSRSLESITFDAKQMIEDEDDETFNTREAILERRNAADGAVWWPWLAYALFSRDATHKIEMVTIHTKGLTMAHCEAIKDVLRHPNPLVLLYGNNDTNTNHTALTPATGPPMQASLALHTKISVGHRRDVPQDGPPVESLSVREKDIWYQVVRDDRSEDFVELILPGTGVCWVPRTDIQATKPLDQRAEHAVRVLTIELEHAADLPAVIELLRLIGQPLESLHLEIVGDDRFSIPTTFFTTVNTLCPNVFELFLGAVAVENWDGVCGDRPNHTKSWELETLSLEGCSTVDAGGWNHLFSMLSNPSHALAKSLVRLHVGLPSMFTEEPSVYPREEICATYCEMLDANVRLQACELAVYDSVVRANYHDRFVAHHNELIGLEKEPLAKAQVLAFLSTTTHTTRSATPSKEGAASPRAKRAKTEPNMEDSARYELDQPMLRSIIEFAAVPDRRMCVFHI